MGTLENETLYAWDDLPENYQSAVIITISIKFKIGDLDRIRRVYELGKPKIIFKNDLSSFRIHEDSQKLISMLTKQYLL